MPIEWTHPRANITKLRGIVIVAIAAKKYRCFGNEFGGLVFLRHKNVLVEVERVSESVFIMTRRPGIAMPNDYNAEQLSNNTSNADQYYGELVLEIMECGNDSPMELGSDGESDKEEVEECQEPQQEQEQEQQKQKEQQEEEESQESQQEPQQEQEQEQQVEEEVREGVTTTTDEPMDIEEEEELKESDEKKKMETSFYINVVSRW